MSSYKNLSLTIEEINTKLIEFADKDSVKQERKGANQHFSFKKDGNDALFIVYFLKTGLLTLSPSGKDKALSEEALTFIVSGSKQPKVNNAIITIDSCEHEKCLELITFLCEENYATQEEKKNNTNASITYKVKRQTGDTLTITHYSTTKKLLIQGRPLRLVSKALNYIATWDFVTEETHMEYIGKIFGIECARQDIPNRANSDYPNLYAYVDSKLKKSLNTVIQLSQCRINFEDPSVILFPAVRAMEGYIKALFFEYEIDIGKQSMHSHFKNNSTNTTFTLIDKSKSKIIDTKKQKAIEECFSFYNTNRHRYVHADANPELTAIPSMVQALSIAQQALEIMEKHCTLCK